MEIDAKLLTYLSSKFILIRRSGASPECIVCLVGTTQLFASPFPSYFWMLAANLGSEKLPLFK